MQLNETESTPVRLLSEEASFITLDMLRQHRRPGDTLAQRSSSLPVYWKTGTSWGFRDAWSVGIFGPYVLVVWEGNFDGRGNNALVGAEAAAPLFFNIIDSVNASYPGLREPKHPFPQRLRRVDIASPAAICRRRGASRRARPGLFPASRRSRSTAFTARWCWIFTAVRSSARRMTRRRPAPKSLSSGLPIWPTYLPGRAAEAGAAGQPLQGQRRRRRRQRAAHHFATEKYHLYPAPIAAGAG